ncbi:porin family protein [Sanguibacteroides justesenii]|uniref:Outer membrane protein beta-barrel domain-containing protein n=1 Tax=Sanguibacteroides justesenii TaxID=1547597 RepID=A0AB34R819_9PORP|nr:porin family protein [Sanguibacteroides justesenii]KIO43647.1 hypothetical protein IE90_11040 [Sanguibacteroides justesenii]
MKKLVLMLVVAVMLCGTVNAQSMFKSRVEGVTGTEFYFGPKFGFNLSNVHNSEMDNKFSFHVGAFAEFKFNDFFGLQPELLYSRQGARDKVGGVKIKSRLNYLNIPVLAKFYVLEALSIDCGPQLDLVLNGKHVAKQGGTTVKEKIRKLNTVGLTFALGATYHFDMGLMVSARYNLGLSNAMDKDAFGDNNQNRLFQLSAGWRF